MSFRVDTDESGIISLTQLGRPSYKTTDAERAIMVIRMYLADDLEKARKERFVCKLEKEAKQAFKQLEVEARDAYKAR
jgi:hypothetical protein